LMADTTPLREYMPAFERRLTGIWQSTTECPHCKTFALFTSATSNTWVQHEGAGPAHIGLFTCNRCRGVIAVAISPQNELWDIYPASRSVPECLPAELDQEFREAVSNLNRGACKSALAMARATLQLAVRERQAEGDSLADEIADLANKHVITPDMADWAKEVRLGGNLALHPKPGQSVSEEEATEIIDFADALLTYLYTIPAQVAARRKHTDDPKDESAPE